MVYIKMLQGKYRFLEARIIILENVHLLFTYPSRILPQYLAKSNNTNPTKIEL